MQCQVQDAGEITIQQQLAYDYEVISDPCAGGQEVQFTVTSGNTTSITLLPGEVLSSDILEAGDVFTEVLTFTPADGSLDEQFNYDIEINGNGFKLVPFNLDMVNENYLSWLKDDAVNKYLLKPNKDITKEEAFEYSKDLIESNNNYFLAK